MITIKEAIKNATDFATSVYDSISDTLLEEVEADTDKKNWYITLSFVTSETKKIDGGPLAHLMGSCGRIYKKFLINSEKGDVISMKIWQTESIK